MLPFASLLQSYLHMPTSTEPSYKISTPLQFRLLALPSMALVASSQPVVAVHNIVHNVLNKMSPDLV